MDCKLKLTDANIIFKPNQKGSKTETLESQEIEMVNWQRLAGSWGIRIFTKSGNLHRFAGFKDTERDRLARFFKQQYDMDMLDKELSVKGIKNSFKIENEKLNQNFPRNQRIRCL